MGYVEGLLNLQCWLFTTLSYNGINGFTFNQSALSLPSNVLMNLTTYTTNMRVVPLIFNNQSKQG